MSVTIQMLTEVTGTRDGQDWPPVGATMRVSVAEATDLELARIARRVADTPVETASAVAPDTAAAPRGRPRKA